MPTGLPDPGKIWNDFITNPLVQTAGTLIVIYVVLLWLGTAYWAFRDMQARSENPILPYFASALIIFFTPLLFLFAVVLYLIVRPRESLAERVLEVEHQCLVEALSHLSARMTGAPRARIRVKR